LAKKPKIDESAMKHEGGGYLGEQPPSTKFCNGADFSQPCGARRVRAFAQALVRCNEAWLFQLTDECRKELRQFPEAHLAENGSHFMKTSFTDTAFCYGFVQSMKPSERKDPEHFDGGASLLHAGVTIFGRRQLDVQTNDGWQEPIVQEPGNVYIGNLCAPRHRVGHLPVGEAEPLFREQAGDPGILIACMFRSNFFHDARARSGAGTPSPVDVYEVVNKAVAQHIARHPWCMPNLAECLQCLPKSPSKGVGSAPKVPP
jgi:hypothetical protein